jgi:hypothetical protein
VSFKKRRREAKSFVDPTHCGGALFEQRRPAASWAARRAGIAAGAAARRRKRGLSFCRGGCGGIRALQGRERVALARTPRQID